jgi:protein TonB
MTRFLGYAVAIAVHAAIVLFGGYFFLAKKPDRGTLQEVELLGNMEEDAKKEEKPKEPEKQDELETAPEEVPDVTEVLSQLELSPMANEPELDAASLSAIEAALDGHGGGGGDFADSISLASGGHIDGRGKAGALDSKLENAFSLTEIDQKPTPVFQGAPLYPSEMRGKKVDGVVTLIFVVDATGKVSNPHVEKSSHTAFEKPALDAVRQWKFEPGIKAGQRVACRLRVPIRFQQSS